MNNTDVNLVDKFGENVISMFRNVSSNLHLAMLDGRLSIESVEQVKYLKHLLGNIDFTINSLCATIEAIKQFRKEGKTTTEEDNRVFAENVYVTICISSIDIEWFIMNALAISSEDSHKMYDELINITKMKFNFTKLIVRPFISYDTEEKAIMLIKERLNHGTSDDFAGA